MPSSMIGRRSLRDVAPAFTLGLAGVVLSFVAFGQGIDNYLVSDDWVFLRTVAGVRTLEGALYEFGYATTWFVRPVQWVVTWAVFNVAGWNPVPYHLASLALHSTNVLLFGLLLWRVFRIAISARDAILLTVSACLLFAVDQTHHETVFWYSSINELLAMFFRLVCLLLVWQGIRSQPSTARHVCIVGAWFAFALALLSKESAVVLLLELMGVYAIAGLAGELPQPKQFGAYWSFVPFLFIFFVWSFIYLLTSSPGQAATTVERAGFRFLSPLEAAPLEWGARYLQHMLNGHFHGLRWIAFTTWGVVLELSIILALVAVAVRDRQWLWLLSLVWLALTVTPYVASIVADARDRLNIPLTAFGPGGDRYLYSAAAPLGAWLVLTLYWWAGKIPTMSRSRRKSALLVLGIAVLSLTIVNTYVTFMNEREWDQAGRMAQDVLERAAAVVEHSANAGAVCFEEIPDSYEGKYVFRNGLASAIDLLYGPIDDDRLQIGILPVDEHSNSQALLTTRCPPELTIRGVEFIDD